MVQIDMVYEGSLHCHLVHGPSGMTLQTDAPKDNMGKGESFSPTDLVASALGACMLTTMGMYAQRHDLNIEGSKVQVIKEMVKDPVRRIGKLSVQFQMAKGIEGSVRPILERVALQCPVQKSIHPDIEIPVVFNYPD